MPKKNKIMRLFGLKKTNATASIATNKFNDTDFSKFDLLVLLQKKIDLLNAKAEKNPEDENMLKEMLSLLKELANKKLTKTDEIVIEAPVSLEKVSQKITSTFAQQLQSVQLKPVMERTIQKKSDQAVKKENGPPVFIMDPKVLASVTLKFVQHENFPKKAKQSELEIRLAIQKAKIGGGNTTNINNVTSEGVLSERDERVNESISLNPYQARILSTIIEEGIESRRNSIIPKQNNESHISSDSKDDSDNYDLDLQEFEKTEAKIALEEALRQKLEEAEKKFEEAYQDLMGCDNKNAKPISEVKAPISAYFENTSPTDGSKSGIVGAIFKPNR